MDQRLWACLLIVYGSTAFAQEVIPRPSDIARQKEAIQEPKTVVVPTGSRVEVQPGAEISVTFAEVTKKGSLTSQILFEGPGAPEGYLAGSPPVLLRLSVDAKHKGSARVCIRYAPELFPDRAADLRILRRQEKSWIDETRTLDRKKHSICAEMERFGVLLLAVRSLEGLYEDLALTVRQLPQNEIKQELIESILQSRQAALDGKYQAFRPHLETLENKVNSAFAGKLPNQFYNWIQYFLRRIEARVREKTENSGSAP